MKRLLILLGLLPAIVFAQSPTYSLSGIYDLKHKSWDLCGFMKNARLCNLPKLGGEIDWDTAIGLNVTDHGTPVGGQAILAEFTRKDWTLGAGFAALLEQSKVFGFGGALTISFAF